jgi:hypothetical protein
MIAAAGLLVLAAPVQAQNPPAGASTTVSSPAPPSNASNRTRTEPQVKQRGVFAALCNIAKETPRAIFRFLGG